MKAPRMPLAGFRIHTLRCRTFLILLWFAPLILPAIPPPSGLGEHLLNEPTLLLERAIYAEEILHDLPTARSLLEQIHAHRESTLPPVWAEATYRLAVRLQESDLRSEARQAASALLEGPTTKYGDWARHAELLLEGNTRIPATAHPWPRDEFLLYRILSPGGDTIGFSAQWLGAETAMDSGILDLRSWVHIHPTMTTTAIRVRTQPVSEGFLPLTWSGKVNLSDRYRAHYDPGTREWTTALGESEQTTTLTGGTLFLDMSQVDMVPRLLDRAETASLSYTVMSPGGSLADASLEFEGMETIVHAGDERRVERWRNVLVDAGHMPYEMTLWVEPEDDRRVLRIRTKTGAVTFELEYSTIRPSMESLPARLLSMDWGYSAPEGWAAFDLGPMYERANHVHFLSGDGRAFAAWLVARAASEPPLLDETVAEDQRRLRSFLQDYTIDQDSLASTTHHGYPAQTFQARYTDRNQPHREFRKYWTVNNSVHWILVRAPEEDWDDHWDAALDLVDGVRPLAATATAPGAEP